MNDFSRSWANDIMHAILTAIATFVLALAVGTTLIVCFFAFKEMLVW